MAKTLSVIFVLSLALLMFSVRAQYAYFQMVQQWPPATCSGAGVKCTPQPPPTMFTIHGLWPSNYSTAQLVCTGPAFDPTQIASIKSQLNTYWPDVIGGNNQGFWQHEWDKHGTCSYPAFSQLQYFQSALNIRTNRNYDLLAILKAAGLGPTGTTVRQYQAVEKAIQTATGKNPGLRCNTNAKTGSSQLFEIILCFDKNGVTLIDCTNYAGITCPSQFVWLPRQPLSLVDAVGEVKDSLLYGSSIPKSLFFFGIFLFIAFRFWKKIYQTPKGDEKQE